MEHILSQLLVPDNAVIQQATVELKRAVKDPNIVPLLCEVLSSSQNPQVRQYAAVLLRRRVMRKRQWKALPAPISENIRQNLLHVLLQEPEKSVRKSLAQLVATIAKHELPENRWPELLQFLQEYTRSDNTAQREMGMYVLSTVASTAGEQLQPHLQSLLELCALTLQDRQSTSVPFNTVQTLTKLVPFMGSAELKPMQMILPKVIAVVRALVAVDEDQACEAMEMFDDLLECEVAVITPHVQAIMEFCVELGANKNLSSPLRVKALSFVSNMTRLKRKTVLKLKMINPLLNLLFPIICEPPADDAAEEDDYDDAESHTAPSYACQVIDVMALNLPPEKLIPALMNHVQGGLRSEDPNHRRAAYMAMAVSAEGCADYVRTKLLRDLLECVYKGLQDPSPVVRNASLFALGQFSEHLQPDISKFSSELLPILFECLGKAAQDVDRDPRGVTKTFYAVEMFCENLGKDILPYLSQLMQYLLGTLSTSTSYRAKELAISAIGATANAAKEEIGPYFPEIIGQLKSYMSPTDDEGPLKMQIQALDTLGVLARTLGEHFRPLAGECIQLGLALMTNATDPDLRRCIYGMFAAVSTLIKADMGPHLERMVKQMLESVRSSEGITPHYAEEESQLFKIFEDEEEELGDAEEEGDEEEEVQGFSVENAYLDEKEDACEALGELAINTGAAFMAHIEDCYKQVNELLDYPSTDIRKAAVTAVGQFCSAVGVVANDTKSVDAQTAVLTMLNETLPKFLKIVHEDTDREVAMATLETLREMIETIGEPLLQCPGAKEKIMAAVKEVLQEKVACQDLSDETEDEADKEQAEFDSILIENAGDIIPTMAKSMGGQAFRPYLAGLMVDLLKRLKTGRPVSERSFAIGTLAETVDAMGPAASTFVPHLYPVFMANLADEDGECRSNAAFAVGVLAANGGDAMYSHYAEILKVFFSQLNKETCGRARDNICAATCRMLKTRIDLVPVHQVLPVIVQWLPFKEDFEENSTVYPCIVDLYKTSNDEVIKQLPKLLQVYAQVLGTDQIKPDIETLLVQMVQDVAHKFPTVLQSVTSSIPEPLAAKLQTCISLCNGSS